MSRAGASLGTSPPWRGVARSGAGREAGTARVHGQALHARCPCPSSLSRARRFLFSPSGREAREGRRQVASACVRGKARLSLEGFRCCLALLPVVYVSHVVTRLFRPQLAGESERQLHVHLQEDSTAISRHTGVPGIRLLSRSRTVPAALPLVDSCEGGSGAQRSRVTRSGSSLLGGRRGLEPPHARAPSPGGTAARAARSLSVSLVPPPCVVFVGAVPGRLGNKAEEPQVSAVRCLRTGGA